MADTPEDHPIRQTPVVYEAVADDAAYRARLDTLEVPDVETLREQYEASPASLGVYCATAVNVATDEDAETVVAAIERRRHRRGRWPPMSRRQRLRLAVHPAQLGDRSGAARQPRRGRDPARRSDR